MTVKALIWDFEGVLLQTGEVDVAAAAAKRLNVPDEDVREIFKGDFNDRMDLGEFTQDEYWEHVLHALDLPENRKENLNDFFYKDLYVDQDVLNDVRQYRQTYKTGLLTNFSRILPFMLENHWKVDGAFDEIVISSEIGIIKPDPRIYRYMLDKLECSASEAVFIDDRILNVEAAREVGLEAILFTNRQEVNQKLQAILA
jgi:putative hydrolase of the HAD superfamily